ncbi:MAG: hypothetical protein A4E20_05665 [Nitrospira sp. SG-bin2]|uniref:PilW family protein n=1 Tax=Nitrospira cf. moscoviensis SBR1015 TaxID=96242 RepID=UPI000A0BA9A7|nr:hypothetical protein [Nitrospira cf. moscoviensis SBR1015]OQW37150.1 MAG: hypothetical protein A4E20_05665 [Nitrospira sp. SG-bin2]
MNGVCLAELLIGLAAGVIVLATALETFSIVRQHVARQQRDLTHQQDLRLGLAVFEQEARLATAESIVIANPDEFQFRANINAQRTTTTGGIVQGQSVLAVQDGSGWGEGKSVAICGLRGCELHRLARAGQRTFLTLAEPVQTAFPAGASVEVRNHVVYYTRRDERGLLRLMRMVDGGAGTLVGGLDNARFAYRDDRGRTTFEPSQVKRVVVKIESNRSTRHAVREVSLRS